MRAGIAFSSHPDPGACIYAGRHFHLQADGLAHAPGAAAFVARALDHRAFAIAARAGGYAREHPERSAIHRLNLAAPAALGACRPGRARTRALPAAGLAHAHSLYTHRLSDARYRFFQSHLHRLLEVVTASRTRSRGSAAERVFTEECVEYAAERVETSRIGRPAAPGPGPDPVFIAESVVYCTLLLIGKHLISLVYLLELRLGRRVIGIHIGVILPGQVPVGLLDVRLRCVPLDP